MSNKRTEQTADIIPGMSSEKWKPIKEGMGIYERLCENGNHVFIKPSVMVVGIIIPGVSAVFSWPCKEQNEIMRVAEQIARSFGGWRS